MRIPTPSALPKTTQLVGFIVGGYADVNHLIGEGSYAAAPLNGGFLWTFDKKNDGHPEVFVDNELEARLQMLVRFTRYRTIFVRRTASEREMAADAITLALQAAHARKEK